MQEPTVMSIVHEEAVSADAATGPAVAGLIRSRRTIHDFLEQAPPPELLREGLELARWAPNHRLTEPWRFYVLGPETREAVSRLNAEQVAARDGAAAGEEKYQRWRRIPGWLLVTCARSDDELRAREDYAATCCAIHNLALFLWSHGVGMKWTTGAVTRSEAFHELTWVDPQVETVVGLIWYGYAAEVPVTARRELDETLVVLP